MQRVAVFAAALLLLSACSGGPSEQSPTGESIGEDGEFPAGLSFGGQFDVALCRGNSRDVRPARCGDSNSLEAAATVCGTVVSDNTLTVRSGSLLVGGASRVAAPLRVQGGSFTSLGGIAGDNTEDIDGDLTTASNWVVSAPAHVGGDAFIGGRIDARNTVRVDGMIHVPGNVPDNVSAGGVTSTGNAIADALSCDGAPDVLAIADATKRHGVLDGGRALASVSRSTEVTLGCGRYRFESLGIDAPFTLHVRGNTVVVVDGNVRIAAPMRVEVAPDASFDMVVGGAFDVNNTLSFDGAPTWLAIGGDVHLAAPTNLTGWLVAPTSEVGADNTLSIHGALYVGALRVGSPVTLDAVSKPLAPCEGA